MEKIDSKLQRTPLFEEHLAQGAKMVPFGKWHMPVSYEGVLAEHKAVRSGVGIFDVSHMGEIRVTGNESCKFVQWLTTNDITKLVDGAGQYTAILKPDGGMIDDLIIYRINENDFFICANASNIEKDFSWIESQSKGFQVSVENQSNNWAQIAIQGPKSLTCLEYIIPDIKKLQYTHICSSILFGKQSFIARTGYTGEWGYEIYVPSANAKLLWLALLERSNETGVKPIGLGARDTLRLEACYLLYGNDMDETVTPLEAGISWATKLEKGDFIGRDALLKQKSNGVPRRSVAFKMNDEGIPRSGMTLFQNGKTIGKVTSGSVLPTVGGAGGMALVSSSVSDFEDIYVDIRGNLRKANIVKKPLYLAKTK